MLGSHYNNDAGYAESRIKGTIVTHEGQPVKVSGVTGGDGGSEPVAVVHDLKGENKFMVNLSDLDLCPPKLGFVNYEATTSYVCRKPMRRDYKQGLRNQNLTTEFGYNIQSIPDYALLSTIVGDFPTFEQCRKKLEKTRKGNSRVQSWAWDYHWAIDIDNNLLHKFGKIVGKFVGDKLVLSPKFNYLQSQLEGSLK